MGASSVSGVGPGSASGFDKGADHETLGVSKLIGPRVVYAGTVTLDGSGDATVKFAVALSGVVADYICLATHVNATAVAVSVVSMTTAQVVFKGTASKVVNFAIVKV